MERAASDVTLRPVDARVRPRVVALEVEPARRAFALLYRPENHAARVLYTALGFAETGEPVDGEVVARLAPSVGA